MEIIKVERIQMQRCQKTDRQNREKPSHTKELGVSEPLVGSTVEDDLS